MPIVDDPAYMVKSQSPWEAGSDMMSSIWGTVFGSVDNAIDEAGDAVFWAAMMQLATVGGLVAIVGTTAYVIQGGKVDKLLKKVTG